MLFTTMKRFIFELSFQTKQHLDFGLGLHITHIVNEETKHTAAIFADSLAARQHDVDTTLGPIRT